VGRASGRLGPPRRLLYVVNDLIISHLRLTCEFVAVVLQCPETPCEGRMVQLPKLREWREARALTQVELAERAGVSPRSVAGYEAGAGARLPTVRKLAVGLDVPIEELTGPPSGIEQFLGVHVEALEEIAKTSELIGELAGTAEEWEEITPEERERRVGYLRTVAALLREASLNAAAAAREALAIERGDPKEAAPEDEPPAKPGAREDRLSSLLATMEHIGTG
jgi:transcriptional regulator with XRE-family HTH domain